MRKTLVILLIIMAVAATATSLWVIFAKPEEQLANTLYDAIPLNAGLIVDVRNYSELCHALRENDLWKTLSKIESIAVLNNEIMLLDSIIQKHEQIPHFADNIIFSFHPVGRDKMQSIGYARIDNDREARSLMDFIRTQLSSQGVVAQRTYDNVNIVEIEFVDKERQAYNFSYAYRGGVFIFSRSSILLEYAIRQIAADSKITASQNLVELIRSAGKNTPANIYLNYSMLPRIATTVLNPQHSNFFEPLAQFADWTELDLNIKPDMLMFNGFTECNDDYKRWLESFLSQPAMQNTLVDAMPSTTNMYMWMGIRYLEQFFADYGLYLEEYKETARIKELDRLFSSFRIDLQKDFAELFEDELALVYANIGDVEPFTVFPIKNASAAINMIEYWQKAATTDGDTERTRLTLDNQLNYTAYRLPFDVPGILFGNLFAGSNRWCVVADNYIVFGNSTANLRRYLHYAKYRNSSLQTDLNYGKLGTLYSARSNLMFYCNPANMENILKNILNANKYNEIQQANDAVSQMQAIVYQLNSTGGKLYNNLFIKHFPIAAETPTTAPAGMQTSWESLLDTAVTYRPQLVRNHNTGEMDIFVQDMANNIYLLNNVGRILWKVKLPEQIISPIYQIDIYRNGKLQMLFNTKNYLYVVDRLGNFVDKFPVKLNSPAVGSVALFDYDNNRQYRMMIAGEDRRVYLYDRTGRQVDGWSFRQTEDTMQTALYHFRTGNRDYIVFADKQRVYILDRQGRTRVTPEYALPVAQRTVIALDMQRSRLALTDTLGTVHFISLPDGKMTQQKIKTFPASHFFSFQDIDGDGQADFIFAANNKLEAFRQDARQIIDVETEEHITLRPLVYEFAANDKRIGIALPQSNQILLYDSAGKLSAGFPLKGSTQFSIGRLDRTSANFNLFVASDNNFLYNYSVK